MKELISILFTILFMLALTIVPTLAIDAFACMRLQKSLETPTKYDYFNGCLIKHPSTGYWIPKSSYRADD